MNEPQIKRRENKVLAAGNLVRDPELKFTPKGAALCRFRIAISNDYKNKETGEWVKAEATFIDVSAWRQTAEECGRKLKKGDPVYVDGRLRSREWKDKDGNKRSAIEIDAWKVHFLERATPKAQGAGESAAEKAPETSGAESEDEVPF